MDQDMDKSVALAAELVRGRRRAIRIGIVLTGVVMLSLGDLYSTLTHMNWLGMVEANPLAAHLMEWGSSWSLTLFKLGTVGVSVGLLLRMRRHVSSEVGAWVLLVIMTALTIHWNRYNAAMATELANMDTSELPRAMRALAAAESTSR